MHRYIFYINIIIVLMLSTTDCANVYKRKQNSFHACFEFILLITNSIGSIPTWSIRRRRRKEKERKNMVWEKENKRERLQNFICAIVGSLKPGNQWRREKKNRNQRKQDSQQFDAIYVFSLSSLSHISWSEWSANQDLVLPNLYD